MAVSFSPILHLPHSLPSPPPLKSSRTKISATASLSSSFSSSSSASQMDLHNQGRQKFTEFPFVSAPHRDLMVNLLSTVEDRLGSHLLPCSLPLDVQHCQNESGSAQASLHVRSGLQSSQIARETMTLPLCPHPHVYLNSFSALPLKKISTRKIRNSIRALSTTPSEMEQPMRGQRLMEFPHLLAPHKDLMVGLISAVDKRLHGHLLPSSASVPPDAEYYQNQSGASQGSLCINRGVDSSHIDFILTSWLHLSLPNGGAMNITNIQGYLKSSTDAPHFQFELVQCSPTYFIFFLDLIPRKDLVLHPDYLKTFYEDSQLEALRKQIDTQVLEAKPYFSSSLYFRNVVSPTGILVSITCEDGGTTERAEEIIRDNIDPIANEVLELWMDSCVCKGGTATIEENERDQLEKRDRMIKSRAVEMDLSSSMPIQFGQDVADRILGVIRGVFRI